MNIQQAKNIPIEQILFKMGLNPQKTNGFESWYLSPFAIEKTASFKVNQKINRWYCHSSGFGGNTVDFTVKYFDYTVKDALVFLSDFDSSFSFRKQILETVTKELNSTNQVEKIIPIQHVALVQYLKSRQINNSKNIEQLKEIHYTINDKNYFALGFQNKSQGWEIRSKYAKICLGKKDISLIHNGSKTLRIYEGFFDYLSFIQIRGNLKIEESDYLILNSVALLVKNISVLSDYDFIELYLDNDTTGDKYTSLVIGKFKNAKDCRVLFDGFKDLNECLLSGSEIKDRI